MNSTANKTDLRLNDCLHFLTAARDVRHGTGSFLRHLVGVYDILRCWSCSSDVCFAGLLHSIYGTEFFRSELASFEDRAIVRSLVGEKVEQLVFEFCKIPRQNIISAAQQLHITGVDSITITLPSMKMQFVLPGTTVMDLLLIEMANLLEQSRTKNGTPALNLHLLHGLAKLSPLAENHPLRSIANFSVEQETEARRLYLETTLLELSAARASLHAVIDLNAIVAEPYILLSVVFSEMGDFTHALGCALKARAINSNWGCAWDRRIKYSDWIAINHRLIELSTAGISYVGAWQRVSSILR